MHGQNIKVSKICIKVSKSLMFYCYSLILLFYSPYNICSQEDIYSFSDSSCDLYSVEKDILSYGKDLSGLNGPFENSKLSFQYDSNLPLADSSSYKPSMSKIRRASFYRKYDEYFDNINKRRRLFGKKFAHGLYRKFRDRNRQILHTINTMNKKHRRILEGYRNGNFILNQQRNNTISNEIQKIESITRKQATRYKNSIISANNERMRIFKLEKKKFLISRAQKQLKKFKRQILIMEKKKSEYFKLSSMTSDQITDWYEEAEKNVKEITFESFNLLAELLFSETLERGFKLGRKLANEFKSLKELIKRSKKIPNNLKGSILTRTEFVIDLLENLENINNVRELYEFAFSSNGSDYEKIVDGSSMLLGNLEDATFIKSPIVKKALKRLSVVKYTATIGCDLSVLMIVMVKVNKLAKTKEEYELFIRNETLNINRIRTKMTEITKCISNCQSADTLENCMKKIKL